MATTKKKAVKKPSKESQLRAQLKSARSYQEYYQSRWNEKRQELMNLQAGVKEEQDRRFKERDAEIQGLREQVRFLQRQIKWHINPDTAVVETEAEVASYKNGTYRGMPF